MSDMKRMSISISPEQEKAILALRKTEEYCRFSYAEIIRILMNRGMEEVLGGSIREKNLLYQNELDRGKSTINEVRKECGLPPVEGGDVLLKKRD